MSNTKEVAEYIYHGLGYPIKLENVRFYLYDGEWLPIIDVNRVALAEYHRLTQLEPAKLTKANQTLIKQVGTVIGDAD
jgi:hypothetical protein